ncbi:spore germination protein GerPC [Paenibacillus caseinilyticus]|uniref:Spore germination protein GerPC n=1 Tax=Paenibacillus mucilaginosus K02 TaxID=997761 RepID=I0BPY9_9BACL|nr:spore germination protein GerPC [Paenibacillus mucilaginosus]AFH64436.1 spore germination protein GerPC [Paenibacillus mucilaginosus K02]
MNLMTPESYFRKLNEYLTWQTERIRRLEQRLESMAQEVDALKKQKGITIEKIEYNFDQLKVDTLEGTLNVGLSPAGLGAASLEDASAGGEQIRTNTAQSESFARIQKNVFDYLTGACPAELSELERQYGVEFGKDFHNVMIGDLQNQVGPRIDYYLKSAGDPGQPVLTEEQEKWIEARVIDDVRKGMQQYFVKKKADLGGADGT